MSDILSIVEEADWLAERGLPLTEYQRAMGLLRALDILADTLAGIEQQLKRIQGAIEGG